MKQLLSAVLTIICACTYSQETKFEKSSSKLDGIQIGVSYSPDYCFRTLKNQNGSLLYDAYMEDRNSRELAKFGSTSGLNINFKLKNNVSVMSGIQYSNKGYKINDNFKPLVVEPIFALNKKIIYNIQYIDIPLGLSLILGKNNIRFITTAGLTTNFLIQDTKVTVSEFSDGRKEKEKDSSDINYEKLNFTVTFSAGIDYKLSDKMNLRIEPTFRYGILKTTELPVTDYLWNGGLNVSYYYTL